MAKLEQIDDKHVAFHCPGCECGHLVFIAGPHPVWEWNGSTDSPTFRPSIMVTYPANPAAIEQFKEWRTERRCHSFVTDGKIWFLEDSTHKLAGKTVELPDFND